MTALRHFIAGILVTTVIAVGLGVPAFTAQDILYFRIGTGSTSGTYFPVGEALANLISRPPGAPTCDDGGRCGVPGVIGVAQATDGSIANIQAVSLGRIESGLAQGDLVFWGYNGKGIFRSNGRHTGLRVIASLYPESVHLVARKGSGIRTVKDLRGKRVSLDRRDSGTYADAVLVLKTFGLREIDFIAAYDDQNRAVERMLEGELDAFLFVGGFPASGISDLAKRDLIDLIPIDGDGAAKIIAKYPFFVEDTIPAGTYSDTGEIKTISVRAQWIVNAEADEQLVYQITRALWHPSNRGILENSHEKGRLIRLDSALDGIATKLHPGAERFYREAAMFDDPPTLSE
ncbi:MAG: TAXI family TRAP transporter solute-binding subunit [Sphingomonadales bacterium]